MTSPIEQHPLLFFKCDTCDEVCSAEEWVLRQAGIYVNRVNFNDVETWRNTAFLKRRKWLERHEQELDEKQLPMHCASCETETEITPCPYSFDQLNTVAHVREITQSYPGALPAALQEYQEDDPLLYQYEQEYQAYLASQKKPVQPRSKQTSRSSRGSFADNSMHRVMMFLKQPPHKRKSMQVALLGSSRDGGDDDDAEQPRKRKRYKVEDDPSYPMCQCDTPQRTLLKKVKKPGDNMGRPFFSCPRYPDGCSFFQWAEEVSE